MYLENHGEEINTSSTKIQWTDNYGLFSFLKGNRDLNERKINSIVESFKNGLDLFKYCPILVNSEYYIIDGQHRFYACKKLNHHVFFIVVPDFSLRQIAEMNNNSSRWKTVDFLNCYLDAKVNFEHYEYLQNFIQKYKIKISVAISLLMEGKVPQGGCDSLEDFKNGEFKAIHKGSSTSLLDMAFSFAPYFNDYRSRIFLKALEHLNKAGKYDHEKMIVQLEKHGLTIDKQYNYKDYLSHLEEKFNYRNSIRKVIY